MLEQCRFPVRLAYSMTINEVQGQTFDKVGIYLPISMLSHGQLYVALTRSFKDIFMQICETTTQGRQHKKYIAQNKVYHKCCDAIHYLKYVYELSYWNYNTMNAYQNVGRVCYKGNS